MSVYFIQGKTGGPIKIGWAGCVEFRLRALQVSHWDDLVVLGVDITDDQDVERLYHRMFAHTRVRGEWYADTPELRALIKRESSPEWTPAYSDPSALARVGR